MKKIIIFVFIILGILNFGDICFGGDSIKEAMIPAEANQVIDSAEISGDSIIKDILLYVKETLSTLIMIFAIGAFMFVGFKLISARGNAEEFKKAIQTFIYTVVGIVLAGIAYAVVALISSFQL